MHLRPNPRATRRAAWVRPAAIAGVVLLTLLAVFAAAESLAVGDRDQAKPTIASGAHQSSVEIAVPRAVPRAMVPRAGIVTVVSATLVAFGVVLVLSASGSVVDDRRRRWRARLVGAPPVLLGFPTR